MNDILILSRDINGETDNEYFKTADEALEYCQMKAEEDEVDECGDEILLVCVCGVCAYSALSNQYAISWEDLIGFLA